MELGRVVEQGTAEEIFVHPKEHLTRDFISTASNMDKFLELVEQNNELTRLGTGDKLVLLTYSANNAGEPEYTQKKRNQSGNHQHLKCLPNTLQ